MKPWPSNTFEIVTTMSNDEVVGLLRSRLRPSIGIREKLKNIWWSWCSGISQRMGEHPFTMLQFPTTFRGKVSRDGFRLLITNNGGLAGFTVLTGEVREHQSKVTIKTRIRFRLLPAAFMCCWLSPFLFLVLTSLARSLNGESPAGEISAPLFMLAAGGTLFSVIFWWEAEGQESKMRRLFKLHE